MRLFSTAVDRVVAARLMPADGVRFVVDGISGRTGTRRYRRD